MDFDPASYLLGTKAAGGGGGGGSSAPKQVNFIDYDGTILHSYTKDEANALTALPANPSHAGLVAQGWNWTLAQIKGQLLSTPTGPVWVGQMYVTESEDTEIDIFFPDSDRLSPILTIAVNGTVTVDWGDGSTKDTVTGNSLTTRNDVPHTYTSDGSYTIKIHAVDGEFTFYSNSTNTILKKNTTANENRVYSSKVSAVRLGKGITTIGEYAFYLCVSLTSITIPETITVIGNHALQVCYNLKSVTIPSRVISVNIEVMSSCDTLTSVAIPNSVTSIGQSAFSGCYSLTSVTIPNSVTSIGQTAFSGCYSLASVTIPNSVTSIGSSMFSSCYSLTSVTIPNSVTSIGSSMFNSCYSLISITIPNSITSIEQSAFANCYSLISIIIPDKVATIQNSTFSNCYCLSSITIPTSVTAINSNAFTSCYGLKSCHVKPTAPPTGSNNMFTSTSSDLVIYVPSASLDTYKAAPGWTGYASKMVGE